LGKLFCDYADEKGFQSDEAVPGGHIADSGGASEQAGSGYSWDGIGIRISCLNDSDK